MKITAPLLLLPLFLAACGTQSATPVANSQRSVNNATAVPTFVQEFNAQVEQDIARLSIGAQATAPKSYLNVLKVSDSQAQAYVKTTYPTEVGCTLDWGDGSTNAITTPTPSTTNIQTTNHSYNATGIYLIKLSCGTDVKTFSFSAIKEIIINKASNYKGGGVEISAKSGLFYGSDFISTGSTTDSLNAAKSDGGLFNVKSIDAFQESPASYTKNVAVTFYGSDDQIIKKLTSQELNAQNLLVNVKGVKKISCVATSSYCDIRSIVIF